MSGEQVAGAAALLVVVLAVAIAVAGVLAVVVAVARPFVDRLAAWAERRFGR